jgi:hypothetical protein
MTAGAAEGDHAANSWVEYQMKRNHAGHEGCHGLIAPVHADF